ncbi:MAG: hypothetical protein ACFFCV_12405 [Promethearchaeota archaeon]
MEKAVSSFNSELLPKEDISSLKVIEMNEDQKLKIKCFYQHLLKSNFPFDALCWALAELELIFEKGSNNYTESDVVIRTKRIFDSDLDYNSLCWLISRFKTYLEENKLYP